MARSRRSFTLEFRREAVQLLEQSGRSVSEVARELGIRAEMLRRWQEALAGSVGLERAVVDAQKPESLAEQNRRLKRELEKVKQERDFLKKAAAYFAQHPQ